MCLVFPPAVKLQRVDHVLDLLNLVARGDKHGICTITALNIG